MDAIPSNVRKARARRNLGDDPRNSIFEYLKFWLPFLLTIGACFSAFMSRIAVLETKVENQSALIQELRKQSLGKDVILARLDAAEAHRSRNEHMIASVEEKLDRHIESDK